MPELDELFATAAGISLRVPAFQSDLEKLRQEHSAKLSFLSRLAKARL
jgi:hypothetical protein